MTRVKRVGDDERVVGFQSVDTQTQEVGLNHVVVRGPFEIFARGLEINIPQVPTRAHVAVGAVVANAIILRGKLPADLLAAISGAVVGDDEFEILECLVQDGLDGSIKETISVVKKEPDADKRLSAHAMICSVLDAVAAQGNAAKMTDGVTWQEVTDHDIFLNERRTV